MADERISQLAELLGANAAPNDLTVVVDVSANETKKITLTGLSAAVLGLAPPSSLDLSTLNQASTTKLGTQAIADGAITAAKIAANTITAQEIGPNAIGASELADAAVDTPALQDLAVTGAKLATGAVTPPKLGAGAVTSPALGDGAVTYQKLQETAAGFVLLGRSASTPGQVGEVPTSAAGVSLLGAATVADQRTALGLGPLATATGTWVSGSSFSGTSSGTNTGDQTITLTGDVTGSGTGSFTATIAEGAVTEPKLATGGVSNRALADESVSAAKLADNSATIVANESPTGQGAFVGQSHYNPLTSQHAVWTGLAWGQTSGITQVQTPATTLLAPQVTYPDLFTASIDLALQPQEAALVLAGPVSGLATAPTFRALAGGDLPAATTLARGAIRLGEGLTADVDGLASLAPATTTAKGGVSVPSGASLAVDASGVLTHAPSGLAAGTYLKVQVDERGHVVGTSALLSDDLPSLDASKIGSGTLLADRIGTKTVTRQKLADYAVAYIQEADPGANEDPHTGCLWFRESTAQLSMWNGNSWFSVGFGRLSEENLRYCGTFNASNGLITGLTLFGVAESLSIGQAIPSATDPRAGAYFVCDTAGNGVGALVGTTFDPGDWILCNGSQGGWVRIDSALGGGSGGSEFLDDLLDVAISTPASDDLLAYSPGGTWVNVKPKTIFVPITAGQSPTTGQLLQEQLLVSDTTADPAIFLKRADGTVTRIAGAGAVGLPVAASDTQAGIVELATTAETQAGTDTARAVTPAGLKGTLDGRTASETATGLIELATAGEVSAGTDAARAVTPATLAPLLAAKFTTASASETAQGIIELATPAEVSTGTDTVRAVTPAGLKPLLDAKFTTASASATVQGIIELATQTEVNDGLDAVRAVTPATLVGRTATDARIGLVELATSAETQTGTDTTRAITPAGLASVQASQTLRGLIEIATQAEVDAGSSALLAVTPSTLQGRLQARFGDGATYAKGSLLVGSAANVLGVLGVGPNGTTLIADSAEPLGVKWGALPSGSVTQVSGVAPIVVTNQTTTPQVSVDAASTSAAGVVQLNTSTSSTSTTQAATPSAVKSAYDLAAAALPQAGGTITGDVNNTATGFFDLPSGTTAQRPVSPDGGMVRFNTDTGLAEFYDATAWRGLAQIDSPNLTGLPTAPTPDGADDSTRIATTEFVRDHVASEIGGTGFAPLFSPAFGGTPTTTSPGAGDGSNRIPTTVWVQNELSSYAELSSPSFTGIPAAPTAPTGTNTNQIATTSYVKNQGYATLASPNFTGAPTAPTPATSSYNALLATTAFVKDQNYALNSHLFSSMAGTGSYALCRYDGGSSVGNNVTVSGSELWVTRFLANGTLATTGLARPSGTWRNMGRPVANTEFSLFQRIA